jgi:hypothetical protein
MVAVCAMRGVVIGPVRLKVPVFGLGCAVAVGAAVGVGVGADCRGVTGAVGVTTGVDVVETGVGLAVVAHPARRKVTATPTRQSLLPILDPPGWLGTVPATERLTGEQPAPASI